MSSAEKELLIISKDETIKRRLTKYLVKKDYILL